MEFCTTIAVEEILNNIKRSNNRNIVISPVSLNLLLNLLASGSKGRTLEQLLGFLGSKNVSQISKKSTKILKLFASNEISSVHIEKQLELRSMEDENSEGLTEKEEDPLEESKLKSLFDLDKVHVSEITKKGPELFCLNAVLVDEPAGPLESSFEDLAKNVYKAKVQSADFRNQAEKASEIVNEWIEKGTKGLIKNPTKPADFKFMISMVLINALYFKGAWKVTFNPQHTMKENFHLLNGQTVETFFMTKIGRDKYEYGSFHDFKLLKLQYLSANTSSSKVRDEGDNEKRFSMYVFLPHEKAGLQELIKKVSANPKIVLNKFFDKLKYTVLAKLWIPKLKFSHNFKASEVIKQMGLKKQFEQGGEFSEMVNSTEIIHKAVIEVNEKGTEAAAFTMGTMVTCAQHRKPPPPPPSFVADHPFIFVIREEVSGVLLFLGVVLNPLL